MNERQISGLLYFFIAWEIGWAKDFFCPTAQACSFCSDFSLSGGENDALTAAFAPKKTKLRFCRTKCVCGAARAPGTACIWGRWQTQKGRQVPDLFVKEENLA